MDRIISEDWQDDEYVIALPDAAYRVFDLLVKATNRIGIDLNQDYCAMAAKRIDAELDQTVIDFS